MNELSLRCFGFGITVWILVFRKLFFGTNEVNAAIDRILFARVAFASPFSILTVVVSLYCNKHKVAMLLLLLLRLDFYYITNILS